MVPWSRRRRFVPICLAMLSLLLAGAWPAAATAAPDAAASANGTNGQAIVDGPTGVVFASFSVANDDLAPGGFTFDLEPTHATITSVAFTGGASGSCTADGAVRHCTLAGALLDGFGFSIQVTVAASDADASLLARTTVVGDTDPLNDESVQEINPTVDIDLSTCRRPTRRMRPGRSVTRRRSRSR